MHSALLESEHLSRAIGSRNKRVVILHDVTCSRVMVTSEGSNNGDRIKSFEGR
jgi:hypothetical protein